MVNSNSIRLSGVLALGCFEVIGVFLWMAWRVPAKF